MMKKWYEDSSMSNDVIISSRVRLARNLFNFPFSRKMTKELSWQMIETVRDAFFSQNEAAGQYYDFINVDALDDVSKTALVENHALSPALIKSQMPSAVILSKDESDSIMINEEDHLRIQALAPGRSIAKVYRAANEIDDLLNERLKYAYSNKYGYLTSCPTNLGTGLRASYMMQLPFLESANMIKPLGEEMNKFGFAIRGSYGEGTQALGSIYQISNQKTLGQSEEEIIASLENIVNQVTDQEKSLRRRSIRHNYLSYEDSIYKAYGILKYARKISAKEAMDYLSNIRIGLAEHILQFKNNSEGFDVYALMVKIQPANLLKTSDKKLGPAERDSYRAQLIRESLPEIL